MYPTCSGCHQTIRETDFFCPNCGKKLHEKPLPVSFLVELLCYVGSVLLPPFGIVWGIKYLKQNDDTAKRIGMISIALTLLSTLITFLLTVNIIGNITSQANMFLENSQEFQNMQSPF